MSDRNENLLAQFRQQHAAFVQQRDQAQVNFQQLVGAIFACEQMIAKLAEEMKEVVVPQGECENVQVDEQQAEQTA